MSEPRRKREFKCTPGPWKKSEGRYGNSIEAQSGRDPLFTRDDGYTTVATFQKACSSMLHADEEENQAANGRLIIAAPAMLALLVRREEWTNDSKVDVREMFRIEDAITKLLDYIESGDISTSPPA